MQVGNKNSLSENAPRHGPRGIVCHVEDVSPTIVKKSQVHLQQAGAQPVWQGTITFLQTIVQTCTEISFSTW